MSPTSPSLGSASTLGSRPAGFFLRVVASLLDLSIVVLATWVLAMLLIHTHDPEAEQDAVVTIFLVVSAAYSVGFNCWKGGTPGKLLFGMRVVRMRDGARLTWHQALARWASYLLSASLFGAGFLMAAFHPLKRTIHDLLGGSRVIRLTSKSKV
ncbi:MAG: RDD family protein [Bdellovibrionia bacterium]